MADDAEDDPVAAGRVGEAGDGSSSASDFSETPFNNIGGAYVPPVRPRNREEVEQFVQVALQAGHGGGTLLPPLLGPGAVGAQGLATVGGLVDHRRFPHS